MKVGEPNEKDGSLGFHASSTEQTQGAIGASACGFEPGFGSSRKACGNPSFKVPRLRNKQKRNTSIPWQYPRVGSHGTTAENI